MLCARNKQDEKCSHYFKQCHNVCDQYLKVSEKITDLKFKGRGQRLTPVTDVHGIIEFVMLLTGKHAANVRRQAAELLVRYLGGDLAIIDEVCTLHGLQEKLAVERPEDPRRVFGKAMPSLSSETQVESAGGKLGRKARAESASGKR